MVTEDKKIRKPRQAKLNVDEENILEEKIEPEIEEKTVGMKHPCPDCQSQNILERAEAIWPRLHLRCLDCNKAYAVSKENGSYLPK